MKPYCPYLQETKSSHLDVACNQIVSTGDQWGPPTFKVHVFDHDTLITPAIVQRTRKSLFQKIC